MNLFGRFFDWRTAKPHRKVLMMSDVVATEYNETPYHDEAIKVTSPVRLHGIARLFGVEAADPDNCRVLELGCAQGTNLINLAYSHPKSSFVGVDLSRRQVESAVDRIQTLGLQNITVECRSILELDSSIGQFDYIICHGIYSWVPGEVRSKILAVFKENLTPKGIGYLSYNAYPGWHIRESIRFYMLEASASKGTQAERVAAAREVLAFMLRCCEADESPNLQLYAKEIRQMITMPDWYFLHDFIAPYCQPFYFAEVAEALKANGMQYLGDSEIAAMLPGNLNSNLQSTLRAKSVDPIRLEHFMDFCSHRMFRRTVLCRAEISITRRVNSSLLADSFVSAQLVPSEPEGDKIRFSHPNGGALESTDPILQAVMARIGEAWPAAISVRELLRSVEGASENAKTQEILDNLVRCAFANLLEVQFVQWPLSTAVTERPRGSAVARLLAKLGGNPPSLRHDVVHVNPMESHVLQLLDGTRTVEEVAQELKRSTLPIVQAGGFLEVSALRNLITQFAKKGLLTSAV